MRFVKVEELPKRTRRAQKNLKSVLEEFINSDLMIVRIEYTSAEYAHPNSCCAAFHRAIQSRGYDIQVAMVNKEVYLIKEEIYKSNV